MYQVLLADDEQSILDSMARHIPWEQYDMKISYTANTGNQAYDILIHHTPDIAILDIRMPGLSGLELSRLVVQNGLKTQIIIMSGYAEFSYAQKAIQYGVLGYCLKPVEYDEIIALLLKAVHNLKRHLPYYVTSDEFLDALEEDNTLKITHYLKTNSFIYDTYYLASSVGDAALQLPDALYFRISSTQYGYLSHTPYSPETLHMLMRSQNISCIGVYPDPVTASDFHQAFHKCIAMAYHFFLDPDCRICSVYHDFSSLPLMPQLQNAIAFGQKDRLCELLLRLIESGGYKQYSIHSAQQLFNRIISSPQLAGDSQDYYIHNYKQLLHEYASFKDMVDSLIQMINASPDTQEMPSNLSNTYFLKIMQYINTYYNENITLKDVAKVVNLNPNYISQLFKKLAGSNFSHYLTDLRITNAKKMLTTTDISINEISLQTGFNDYFYFLKTFKKYTGKTPSEYRDSYCGQINY